jgi:hypothetical protein
MITLGLIFRTIPKPQKLREKGIHMSELTSEEMNITEHWLVAKPKRWVAGAMAGAVGGAAMLLFGMIAASLAGYDLTYALKIPAIPVFGGEATATDSGFGVVLVGVLLHTILCSFWGFVFSHFTYATQVGSLIGMGLTWGTFSWIFLNNLFFPSFRAYHVLQVPQSTAFVACLIYGVVLALTVKVLDRS